MKKTIFFLAVALSSLTLYSCGDIRSKKPASNTEQKITPSTNGATAMYECPMKCNPASAQPGKCSKCGMDLKEVK